jgi:hypothetical protein
MITSAADERIQEVSATDDELVVAFVDGRTLSVPLVWYPRLLHASTEQRSDWRLIGDGEGVHWPQIDEDLSAAGLLRAGPGSTKTTDAVGVTDASNNGEEPTVERTAHEAARRFAETLADSYRLVYGQAAESAARQQQRAQEFSELLQGNLKEQAEAGRSNAQQLSEQASRQQEAEQEFARESVEAYTRFLDEAFSRYRAGTEQALGNIREGTDILTETGTGMVGTATRAAGGTADAVGSAAETSTFPIEGYDEMNVEEVSGRLEGLSAEELQLVRDYEERNKGRETLLERMNRKIRGHLRA